MVTDKINRAVHYFCLIIVLGVMAFPLLWMFRVSVMPAGSLVSFIDLWQGSFTLSNFADLFTTSSMGRYLFNSSFVALIVTSGNVLFCFMVAYALARYRSIVNRILFISVIVVLMIPAHILIVPLYIIMLKAHLYDTYWALILPWLVNPIGIFLLKQYIESVPSTMEDAARVDGAGEFRIIMTIVMPLCKPALAVVAIQIFFTNWNLFLFPFILTSSESLRTLPVALAHFQGQQAIDWQHLMAGSAIAVIPVLIIFIILQKRIVSGITAGAVKQ
jgi:multiple sugar transport system permease protein